LRAVEMQRASRGLNDPLSPERRLELRVGVNLGDVIVDRPGYISL
jgi:class 3 adenylate cyclase